MPADPRHGITGLDHVLVGVHDLEAARSAWQRLGFTLSPRGKHFGWGTANYCIMLERDYIELLGIVDPSQFTNNLDRFLESGEGLMGVAFACADAGVAAARLAADGLSPDGPKDLARLIELPEGAESLKFRLVFLPAAETPGVKSFICQHLTRALAFRPQWQSHDNGATALTEVALAATDPAALAPAYRRLLGAGAVQLRGELAVDLGAARFIFASGRAPAGLSVRVRDPTETARHLTARGVRFRESGDRLEVAPEEATGVALSFVGLRR